MTTDLWKKKFLTTKLQEQKKPAKKWKRPHKYSSMTRTLNFDVRIEDPTFATFHREEQENLWQLSYKLCTDRIYQAIHTFQIIQHRTTLEKGIYNNVIEQTS